jgi:hypothetical protein
MASRVKIQVSKRMKTTWRRKGNRTAVKLIHWSIDIVSVLQPEFWYWLRIF